MSQRIPNAVGVFLATDPVAGDVKVVGIVPGAPNTLVERTSPNGPSGVEAKTPGVTVVPTFTVT